jgi:hypothetical protein
VLEACHRDVAEVGGALSFLEVDEVGVLVNLVEVHFVEVADAREYDAVGEFADIVEVLLEDGWVGFFGWCSGWVEGEGWEDALGEGGEFDGGFSFGIVVGGC